MTAVIQQCFVFFHHNFTVIKLTRKITADRKKSARILSDVIVTINSKKKKMHQNK